MAKTQLLTQTEEKKVRKKLMGGRYLMLETRKDGTKFTTKGLKEAAERLQGISRSYDQRQHALVEQVQFAAMCSLYALLAKRSAAGRLPGHLWRCSIGRSLAYHRPHLPLQAELPTSYNL